MRTEHEKTGLPKLPVTRTADSFGGLPSPRPSQPGRQGVMLSAFTLAFQIGERVLGVFVGPGQQAVREVSCLVVQTGAENGCRAQARVCAGLVCPRKFSPVGHHSCLPQLGVQQPIDPQSFPSGICGVKIDSPRTHSSTKLSSSPVARSIRQSQKKKKNRISLPVARHWSRMFQAPVKTLSCAALLS